MKPSKKRQRIYRARALAKTRRKKSNQRGGSALLSYIPNFYYSIYNIFHGIKLPPSIQPWIY